MDVAPFINELLNQERFVYVPGLGTFLTRKTTGAYNQAEQYFYPPKNSIDFVSEEKKDDALEQYISRQKNISSTAAGYFIGKFVEQLKMDAVNKNLPVKEALFPEADEVVFGGPKKNTFFNQENFGLLPVHLSLIKKEPTFTEKEAVNERDGVPSDILLEGQEETEAKKSTQFWIAIFLLLIIGILGCYALYLYYPDRFIRFTAAKQPTAVVNKTVPDATRQQQDIVKKTTKQDTGLAKAAVDTPSAITKSAVKPIATDTAATAEATDPDLVEKSPYEIIGATFKTLKGAKKFVNQLKEKGMRAKILKTTSDKHKLITFGSFKDIEPARAALEKLRARDPNSDAHIQHYNK